METTVKERLEKEHNDLCEKIIKLKAFINSDKYDEFDRHMKDLLCMQLDTMNLYDSILFRRIILLIKDEEEVNNGKQNYKN